MSHLERVEQLVAVSAVIFRSGSILAMRRSAVRDAGAGLWEVVSGRVHVQECPFQAVKREVQEETGLHVQFEERPVDVYAAFRGAAPMVVIVYRADYISGCVSISSEHDRYDWLTPKEFAARTSLARLAEAVRRAAAATTS